METHYRSLYAAHVAEVHKRWALALEAESFSAALVHSGTPMYSFLDDYEYAFRPNPHFLSWLPLTHHADSALLIVPGEKARLYYFQPDDYWYLPPADPEPWWADHFEIEIVRDANAWKQGLQNDLPDASIRLGDVVAIGDSPQLAEVFDSQWINPQDFLNRIHIGRTRKTPYEIACIDAAARLAARAHVAAEQAFRAGESEYGIHMRYMLDCEHTDTQLPYNNIVALNSHSAVLHYQGRERQVPATVHSFLLDAGCVVNGYASDITRSYAREDGEFAELIAAMDRLELDLVGRVRAGVDYKELFLQSHYEIAVVLADFGIIRVPAQEAVETGLSSVFYPHGLGHFLGLQVHDVAGFIDNEGNEIPRPEGHPALRLTRVLEENNVLTIEPGLYFVETLLARWREQNGPDAINWDKVEKLAPCGGVRIEDNVVVRAEGCDNLTRQAFSNL